MEKAKDIIVYTCITNGKNKLEKFLPEEGVRYICFTNEKLEQPKETPWELLPLEWEHESDPRRTSRYHKINSGLVLPTHDWSVWLDGNIRPMVRQKEVIEWMNNRHFATIPHMLRNCLYDEMVACMDRKKESKDMIEKIFNRYKTQGVPPNLGLHATGVLIRRFFPSVVSFCTEWWKEVAKYSKRDQLSFDYIRWKRNFEVATLKSDWYKLNKHQHME